MSELVYSAASFCLHQRTESTRRGANPFKGMLVSGGAPMIINRKEVGVRLFKSLAFHSLNRCCDSCVPERSSPRAQGCPVVAGGGKTPQGSLKMRYRSNRRRAICPPR